MPRNINISNTDLTTNKRGTFLTEDVVVGGSTLRVQSVLGFESLTTSSGQIICVGPLGNERTELLRTSNSTGPSQSYKEVTLRDTLNFDHPQDTPITIVDWNRAEVQWSVAATGTKSTLTAYPVAIQPDQLETIFTDASKSSGFYFVRFNENIANASSDWSDAIPFAGFDDNSVYSIKRRALDRVGESIDGVVITNDFLNTSLWEARRDYHNAPGKRPFRRNFNAVIGSALTGSFRIELPTDTERPYTAENIYGVRIGTNANMTYIDKKEWDFSYRGVAHSTLDVPYTRGTSTSIWLANGRDFSQSAVINIEGTPVSVTRITGSQNSFTVVSHGSWSASGGSDAWENANYGLPDKFTVFANPAGSAYIYFNRPIETAYINQNIYADYYRTLLGYDTDGDVLDEPDYDMYPDYLAAKIKYRRQKGQVDLVNDPDFKIWLVKRNEALSREYVATDIRISPDIPPLPY